MTRKLHNTLMGIVASSCLLVLGLIAAVPASPELDPGIAVLAGIDTAEAALATGSRHADVDAGKPGHRVHRSRQTVAMPFFSFAPRG